MRRIVVGSRGSRLALIQAEWVLAKLKEAHPSLPLSLTKITTTGDRDSRLFPKGGTGERIFVKELEEALLDGRIDVAVHSLKDLPTQIPQGLSLAAVPARLDPRDVLVSRGGKLSELAPGARIGTGSPRRAVQLLAHRPDLEVAGVRGNVDTRLRKLYSDELDGVILAAAALTRLGWEDRITEYLPLEHFLPAVGQGALGIEIRGDDAETAALLSPLNHQPTWSSMVAERTFLREVGGGCRAPIAALGTVIEDRLRLEGMVASPSQRVVLRASEEGNPLAPDEVGARLARRLLEMGALEIIAEARLRWE
ncbi:MAG TPA: hydroxymethylbilane synthase [Dehalococcoidia bacterium]|nr:hydroxymethylbilane synthase [Dehalococcoidia bacterium]